MGQYVQFANQVSELGVRARSETALATAFTGHRPTFAAVLRFPTVVGVSDGLFAQADVRQPSDHPAGDPEYQANDPADDGHRDPGTGD